MTNDDTASKPSPLPAIRPIVAVGGVVFRGEEVQLVQRGRPPLQGQWSIPGGKTMGIGGAMDLAAGARRIIVLTDHVTKKGLPKLVAACSFPLTAAGVVDRVMTDLAVLDCAGEGFRVVERAPGVSLDEVREKTAAPLLD